MAVLKIFADTVDENRKRKGETMHMNLYLRTAACLFAAAMSSRGVYACPTVSAREIPPSQLSVQYGNVLGKGIQKVTLTAVYENKGLYAKQVTVCVRDPETEVSLCFSPEQNAGYCPAILLADFTGDGTQEIFLGMDSGGSGGFGFYYIFSLEGGKVSTVFDSDTFSGYFEAAYADNYRVNISDSRSGGQYAIDLSSRDREYLSSIYNENGQLRRPLRADVSGVHSVLPFFVNRDNRYHLLIMHRITGLYNADVLGYTQEFLRFDSHSFATYFTAVATV